jgi:thiol-disulfide isomerase/thioredoxin
LAKELISQPAPAFSLVDLEGNKVSLAELKGKVVILDFWATWCAPCKKSFPAMQKALDKYKADPNVRFLFIDTWERIPEPKKAVQPLLQKINIHSLYCLTIKTPKWWTSLVS